MIQARESRRLLSAFALASCGVLAAAAWGQSKATLSELEKLHARFADPERVLTLRDAKQAADRLTEWKLAAEELQPQDRARLWRVELYIALARGDAAAALERARKLLDEFPDDSAALEAAYLAACAGGDAKLGSDVLKKLSRRARGDARQAVSQRRRWMRGVGKKAPEVIIRTEDMTEFSTTSRGDRVLVIDFWNVLTPPGEAVVQALRDLHEEYRRSVHVDFLGVNADSETRAETAKQFAQEHGYVWKQRYEYSATSAPITHRAFHAGNPPWHVLIDTFGYQRAVGAADEPGFQYALRAAVAEAGGEYEVVMPRDRQGHQAQRASAQVEPKTKKSAEAAGELPSSLEAQAKLRKARLFMKSGKKTDARRLLEEIVRDYPGTREAQDAQEILDLDFNP